MQKKMLNLGKVLHVAKLFLLKICSKVSSENTFLQILSPMVIFLSFTDVGSLKHFKQEANKTR